MSTPSLRVNQIKLPDNSNALRVFDVKAPEYGAKGDGTTDDTTAVQAAITAAGTGGRVYFPSGNYKITSTLTLPTFMTLEGPGFFLGASIPAPAQLNFTTASSTLITAGTNVTIRNLFLEGPGTGTAVSSTTHIQCDHVQFDNWSVGLNLNGSFYTRLDKCEFHADAIAIQATTVYNLNMFGVITRLCPQSVVVTDRIAALNIFGGSFEGWTSAAAIVPGANSLINVTGAYFESSVAATAGTVIKNNGSQNTFNLIGNQVYLTEASKFFDGNSQNTTTLFARGNKFVSAIGSSTTPTGYALASTNSSGGSIDIGPDDWSAVATVGATYISGTPGAGGYRTIDSSNVMSEVYPTMNHGSSSITSGQTWRGNSFSFVGNSIAAGVPSPFVFSQGAYTNITASTESIGENHGAVNKTWLAGALGTQREFLFQIPTYAFASASTITNAATVDIVGAPAAGTNATITNAYALRVEAGASQFGGTVTLPAGANSTITAQHYLSNGTAPGVAAAGGAGTGPTISLIQGTDSNGLISVTTGTTPSAATGVVIFTYNQAYAAQPNIIIMPGNANAASLTGTTQVYVDSTQNSTSSWRIMAGSAALTAGTVYKWWYMVMR